MNELKREILKVTNKIEGIAHISTIQIMCVERVHVSCHEVTLRQANPHLINISQLERGNNR